MFALNREIFFKAARSVRAHELFVPACVSAAAHMVLVIIMLVAARPDAVELFIKKRRVFVPAGTAPTNQRGAVGNEYYALIQKLGLVEGLLPEDCVRALLQLKAPENAQQAASRPSLKKPELPKKAKKEVKKAPGASKAKPGPQKPSAQKKGSKPTKAGAVAKESNVVESAVVPPVSAYIPPSVFNIESVAQATQEPQAQQEAPAGVPGNVASAGYDDGIVVEDIISIATENAAVHPWARDEERSIALAREISAALNAQLCLASSIDNDLLTMVRVVVNNEGRSRSVEVISSSGVPIRDAEIKRAISVVVFPPDVRGRVLELSR